MNFIIDNIFRNPPILLGLIAALGLLLQKKSIGDVVKGALLAAFGMYILQIGTGLLVNAILPINILFQNFSDSGATEALTDVFTAEYGGTVGLAMLIGFGIHLLIARFTRIKVIFLTGHFLWWFPFIFVAAGVEAGLSGTVLVIFGAVTSALYWSIMPWLLRKYVSAVTEDESFTLGHPSGILSLISGFVAKKFGNKAKSTEDLNIPKGLSFFKEVSIMGGLVIFIMFTVLGLTVKDAFSTVDQPLFFYAFEQALMFGAGLIVMLQGVRMLVNQIIPAFQGISEKLVPDAIPALDCPILFNYKPNAAIIGFVVAMILSTALIIIANVTGLFGVILIPLVITSFFECGTAAVIGEGQGGLKGAILGTSAAAIFMVLLAGVSAIVYSSTIQDWILIFGGNGMSFFGSIAKFIGDLIGLIA
ncbi:PTS ascorbate transporter subunit IIC [Candidatus Izimaplasma bacterium ZiA1]|uniref:PTS ascorbate transporter subunit IIC n=1 Tax=Candidatus Izimoplasma sp. ZiA1 TaxID=2024899 RepID=UPI000BAA851E|nr:PTS ascorbate transporter subunit IIC [Candidatus Izimaplasma bacterium ZiA1]